MMRVSAGTTAGYIGLKEMRINKNNNILNNNYYNYII